MKKIFYEKVGRRYKPIRLYDDSFMNAFPIGTHLIVCRPGISSHYYNIDPAVAPMLAAGKYAEHELSRAIVKGLEGRPGRPLLTDRQRELWTELNNSFNDQDFVIHGPAAISAARDGLAALEKEAEKMLTVPAVKLAYDHFMTVWALTKEAQKQE